MTSKQIREKYIKFFTERGHKEIAPAKLVPENDPSTLFTSSGMQPLVPYLLGQTHPEGKRLVNSQPSFRAEDIEEVGDNRHTTFFEMLGNWSLGDYFKKEQLEWFYQFLTEELGLDEKRLHVTYFEGNDFIPKDAETFNIWKDLGIAEERSCPYGIDKNWWSRSGEPEKMPVGEIGGTDSEVFYEFPQVEHDPKFGDKCHPHCDCGHFMEIGNSVFIEYKKTEKGFEKLPNKNVDFGGGLERLTAATLDNPDVFQTDLYRPVIEILEKDFHVSYHESKEISESFRILSDHLKAAVMFTSNGVLPANKMQGYVLRRLIRRAMVQVKGSYVSETIAHVKILFVPSVVEAIGKMYQEIFPSILKDKANIIKVIETEMQKFQKTLERGLYEISKITQANGKVAFDLYQSYGFPFELTEELFRQKGQEIDKEQFKLEFEKHRKLSRTASAGMFKGGLADHSEVVTKYHTATHLLHQALRDVLGPQVFQKGSNITSERLRFDFSFDRKMTDEEIKKVEKIVNERIKQDLKVGHMIVPLNEAKEMNAIGLFDEKYADKVSIYGVGPGFSLDPDALDQRERGGYYSLEFCGGPHVEHTGAIGGIKITKEEAVSSGMRRIRAEIVIR